MRQTVRGLVTTKDSFCVGPETPLNSVHCITDVHRYTAWPPALVLTQRRRVVLHTSGEPVCTRSAVSSLEDPLDEARFNHFPSNRLD